MLFLIKSRGTIVISILLCRAAFLALFRRLSIWCSPGQNVCLGWSLTNPKIQVRTTKKDTQATHMQIAT